MQESATGTRDGAIVEGTSIETIAAKGASAWAPPSRGATVDRTIDITLRTEQLLTVVKRDGRIVPFRRDRIAVAVEGAFRDVKGLGKVQPLSSDLAGQVAEVTDKVVSDLLSRVADRRAPGDAGNSVTVEGIQDLVEVALMRCGHYDVARGYIVYRDEHKQLRADSPRNLKVLRRDGKTLVRFNPMRIAASIEKAFRASHQVEGQTPAEMVESVNRITDQVVERCVDLGKGTTPLSVEGILDEVERLMMTAGHYQEAKAFILYRAKRAEERQREMQAEAVAAEVTAERTTREPEVFRATASDGSTVLVSEQELRERIEFACQGFGDLVSSEEILSDSLKNFYEGIRLDEIDSSNIFAARGRIERDPAYSNVAARLLLDVIYRETFGISAHAPKVEEAHRGYFQRFIERGIDVERLNPELRNFDLTALAKAVDLSRDLKFDYLGLQTLYDRYLLHEADVRFETPQFFWMRVAMGLSLGEGSQRTARAIEFYNVLSQFTFVSSTPTLFNSGTLHSQMSSCYLSTVQDDLSHIFKCISDDAQLSKWAGGLGNDWTNVRATGARIKGTNGRSQGVIPFLKVANDTAVAVNQGGKRKGAMCAYLETWHLDVEDFLELRKNTGDERRRTHDMNTANWIPDLFMKRVVENGTWTLFSPSDVADLHDLYGKAFDERYAHYESLAESGQITLFKKVEALALWRKMLSMLFETGHPWITFKDPSNIRSPQGHKGVVHSSNLCTEILLNTSVDEVAVCNLGSINLAAHMKDGALDHQLLHKTVRTAVRMLDNVIDINFYPIVEAQNANLRHRPIGLGIMGFQDALYEAGISYASTQAVEFSDSSMEAVSYYAILASSELAAERGSYGSYEGSQWERGILPIDSLDLLAEERGSAYLDVHRGARLDWSVVRESIKTHGMRNSNTMAIAPTATISNIVGVTQSIEPAYKHLYSKSNLSGEFIVHNHYLVAELKKRGLWDADMIDDLKYFDGSIAEIERIPDELKDLFLTAFEIDADWLIECASRRQKWIDMGQSLNLYIAEPSGRKLHEMYTLAWKRGLKTTYYLRSVAATQIEKSTTDVNRRGVQPRWMKNKSASSNIQIVRETEASAPEMPKSCNLDGDCESCQ
jgi:ribonucleoside-diphosphate reductase alpha chain